MMRILIVPLVALLFLTVACQPVPPQSGLVPSGPGQVMVEQAVPAVQQVGDHGEPGQVEVEILGGDESALRSFVARWFAPFYPGAPADKVTVQLDPQPQDLPYDLPLLPGAQWIAGISGQYVDYQLLLDADLTTQAVLDFYDAALAEGGWQARPKQPDGQGFVPYGETGRGYCFNGEEAFLWLETFESETGPTHVRLNLHSPAEFYQCTSSPHDPPGEASYGLIPTLRAPRGTQISGGGGGTSGDTEAYHSATLRTSRSVVELESHFALQLEQASWTFLARGGDQSTAWSAWQLVDARDESWSGVLVLIAPGQTTDTRLAFVLIERRADR